MREEGAAPGFGGQFINEGDRFVAWALADKTFIGVQFVHESDQVNLDVLFAQPLEQFCFRIVAGAIFAVCHHDQRAATAIVIPTLLVFGDVFGGQIHAINYCGLATFDIERVQTIQ